MSKSCNYGKQKREIFITTPLRAAHSLRNSLQIDELNFQRVIGYAHADPRAYFINTCLNEITKFATACVRWDEFLTENEEVLDQSDPEATKIIYRATIESVADEQQMWARKLNEMASQLILFTTTNENHFYQLYLLGSFLDQYQRLQSDFNEFYEIKNENVQQSIDDAVTQIKQVFDHYKVESFWFFSRVNTEKKIKRTTAKELFKQALKLASSDQKLILGITYEIGYSSPSRSTHINIGGISNPTSSAMIENELMRMSLVAMHVMMLAHHLTGIQTTGEAMLFEKAISVDSSTNDLFKSITNPTIEIGDLVSVHGNNICLVEEKEVSKYGYCTFKVKYLSQPLLPGLMTDRFPARHVKLIASKETLKNQLKKIFSDILGVADEIGFITDEVYTKNILKVIANMEKSGDLKLYMRPSHYSIKTEQVETC